MIVPKKVEEKIRYLLRKFPHTEWSGVLFVVHEGTFENNDLIITCQDIYPMDLGNAVYTEFNMNEDVAAYMADNIDLFNCELMLIHSHHDMSTQPSGTDLQTLKEEGNGRNCFVSLIVNNAGKYYAAVTRKVQTKSEVTIKKLGTSYEFFGEGTKDITHDDTETTKVIDKEVIEYFDLDIERHEIPNNLAYLDDRFEEIEKKKAKEVKATKERMLPYNPINSFSINDDDNFWKSLHSKNNPKELSLFEDTPVPKELTSEDEEKLRQMAIEWTPNEKKIHRAVCNILACNLIINPDKFDLKQWVHKHMVNMYKRIFGEKFDDRELNPFNQWKEFIIQFTLDNFDDAAPDELLDDWDLYVSKVAEAIWNELTIYANENAYVQAYQEALECYIVE